MNLMAQTDEQPPPPAIRQLGYEPSRINVKAMTLFVVCFLLTAAVLHTGLWFLEKHYAGLVREADVPQSLVPRTSLFIEPHLQPTPEHDRLPEQDLAAMRQADREVFDQLGWQPGPAGGAAVIPEPIVSQLAARQAQRRAAPATTRSATQRGDRP
jgi:hypothetical protein